MLQTLGLRVPLILESRERQILEDLAPRPGPRILLPSVRQRGQISGRRHHSETIDKLIILAGEALVDEQARDLAVL